MRKQGNIYFDIQFLLGLYLFLRQIDLSIDRALGEGRWVELVEYFTRKTQVARVCSILESAAKIDLDENLSLQNTRPQIAGTFSLLSIFRSRTFLTSEELLFVYAVLQNFSSYLKRTQPSLDELVELRADLCYAEQIIDERIAADRRIKFACVEHFNENPIANCKSIEQIIGGSWP